LKPFNRHKFDPAHTKFALMNLIGCHQGAMPFSGAALYRMTLRINGAVHIVGLTYKHYTRQETLARDKHFSLLWILINYGQKSFITLAPGL